MTKRWAVCLLTSIAVFSACNDLDFLEEVPKDFLAPQNAYNTKEGISQGITGLHFRVRNDWYFGEELQDVGAIYKGLGTDIAFHGEDPNSTRFLCNYVNYLTPSSEYVKEYWDRPYKLVQQVNLLVEGINTADESLFTPEERNALIAEALFFRAYAYRHLVSFFGDVPVVTETIDFAKTDFVRDPTTMAYQLMEEDLTFAIGNLPNPGSEEAPGRITKGAAYHLLTEVYLMQHKYNEAVQAATHVIDDFGYQLMTERFGSNPDVFGSGDAYSDLFAYGNQNLKENKEGIWVIQFEPSTVIGGSNNRWTRAFGPAYFRMGNTPDGKPAFRGELVNGAYTGYSDSLGRGVSWIRPTNLSAYTLWEGNWNNDIRNAKHMIKRDFYYDSPGSAYDGQKIDFSKYPSSAGRDPIRDTCQYIYPYFLKFADPMNVLDNEATSGNGASYKDLYAMRLAETYLFRAEAYIGLGELDLAKADINSVRARSHAKPAETGEIDIDYLLDERARELYGEDCRHFVLRRTGKLIERVRKYNNNPLNPGLNIQDYHVLWPVPQDQIDLNIDQQWTQNTGY
ncbi:Starch-binding associating with outer membrane [Parapedobacter indicus]|uniref:Starch-binding associating with outer membrane n=2 Tax=Parapedobacter indicus TaxID=1477437 RepID=A0A1I3CF40_9SPHI|nr:putative outer membrane starch-binding protein [Parapedobacter indicus]SFH73033.1 Starch-binding associating with outer membrane [Parapedobacter indicus]